MKNILFTLAVFLSLAFVSANVLELVAINQDTLDSTGAFIGPRSSLAGTTVEGYLCGDATCTFSTGIFLPSTFISGSSITIDYPTALTSPFGYALFYTKPGYLPYEVRSTYAGTGSVIGEAILTHKQSCSLPLVITTLTNSSNLTITGTLTAPLTHAGPLPFVPPSLLTHYQTPAKLALTLSNATFTTTTTQSPLLAFSETQSFTITSSAPNATYAYTLTATSTDTRCLATPSTTSSGTTTLGTLLNTTIPTNTTNTSSAPTITIISPQELTYNTSTILINLSATNASTITAVIPGFLTTTYTAPFILNLTNGTYTLTATASNGTQLATASITFAINTSLPGIINGTNTTGTNTTNTSTPNLPPATVTNLRATNQTTSSITWNWTNPTDADFSHVQLFLNNLFVGNTSTTTYTASGLLSNTTYTLALFTVDNASISNTTAVSNTTYTLPGVGGNSSGGSGGNGTNTGNSSLGIPGGVLNLQALTHTNTSITWNWTNPSANFSYAGIYLNGVFQLNTSATNFTALNLQPNTIYTLSVFTFNASGTGSGIPTLNTTSTLANPTILTNQTNTNNGGNGKTNKKQTTNTATPRTYPANTLFLAQNNSEALALTTRSSSPAFPLTLIWLLIALLLITLGCILYLLTATKPTKKAYKMPGF